MYKAAEQYRDSADKYFHSVSHKLQKYSLKLKNMTLGVVSSIMKMYFFTALFAHARSKHVRVDLISASATQGKSTELLSEG